MHAKNQQNFEIKTNVSCTFYFRFKSGWVTEQNFKIKTNVAFTVYLQFARLRRIFASGILHARLLLLEFAIHDHSADL